MSHTYRRRHQIGISTIDRSFDALVPAPLRRMSRTHWTPVDVAIRAAGLLSPTRGMRVLDVGAGIGKLCAVGAMVSGGLWCGVELQAPLVDAARQLARALGVARNTLYLHADALTLDWRAFDAVYLYNPFEPERLSDREQATTYRMDIALVEARLAHLPAHTRVVTLHGFGGVMPRSYDLVYQERVPVIGLDLVLWVQSSRAKPAPRAS
ncbi:MAG TPA: class I SAM-dependent methyltransferase [Kofleriaceae bacterium]|nr:class I SAM-dependent methyltransferase [Kofleriaceae bacterium]